MLKPVWRATNLSDHTKIKIFRSNMSSILLSGAELGVPLTHPQDLLAQHHLKQRTEKYNTNGHSSRNHTNTAEVGTCFPHALQLHRQNSHFLWTYQGKQLKRISLVSNNCIWISLVSNNYILISLVSNYCIWISLVSNNYILISLVATIVSRFH